MDYSGPYPSAICIQCRDRVPSGACCMGSAALARIESAGRLLALPARSVLLREGEFPHFIFGIYEGLLEISMVAREGKSMIVGQMRAGEIAGLSEALNRRPSEATIETLEPSVLRRIPVPEFFAFLESNERARSRAAEMLAAEYQKLVRDAQCLR